MAPRTRSAGTRARARWRPRGRWRRAVSTPFCARAEETVAAAIEFAESSPWPDPATAAEGVYGIDVNLEGKP